MSSVVEICEVKYFTQLSGGGDVWRITGIALNHPTIDGQVCPSSPVSFDKENKSFTTYSGRTYKILSFAQPEEEFWNHLEEDVENGGFGRC